MDDDPAHISANLAAHQSVSFEMPQYEPPEVHLSEDEPFVSGTMTDVWLENWNAELGATYDGAALESSFNEIPQSISHNLPLVQDRLVSFAFPPSPNLDSKGNAVIDKNYTDIDVTFPILNKGDSPTLCRDRLPRHIRPCAYWPIQAPQNRIKVLERLSY